MKDSLLRWPRALSSVAIRVPIVVALLMIAISTAVSLRALERLEDTQQRNLQQLSSAYLDGLSASLLPSVVREDVWEVFDTLDRSRELYKGLNVQWVIVANAAGYTIASSSPDRFPPFKAVEPALLAQFRISEVVLDDSGAEARMARPLIYQDREIGRILALADISSLLQERADILRELIITNIILTILLVAVGSFAMRRMLHPVGLLSRVLSRGRDSAVTLIPEPEIAHQSREFKTLFRNYNAMAAAVNEREILAAELAEEEKLASVGRLASGMAHEINNPLGGMFNALDSLKKYGARDEVRATSLRLLEQGLSGIRDLVRSTLTTYRNDQRPRNLTATDLDDLRLLVKPEARQRKLGLDWRIDFDEPVPLPAVPMRDAILNLLLNACHSCRENGTVALQAVVRNGRFEAEIADQGDGLPAHMREYLERSGAGAAPLDRRSGLGLWIVKRHCDELRGRLEVLRSDTTGTVIRFVVPLSKETERAA